MSQNIRYNYTYDQNHDSSHGDTRMTDLVERTDHITVTQMVFILRVLLFGVTPVISILGIVGNIFSIIILLKHGMHKCSNILLISLAVADLTALVSINNIPRILYDVVGIRRGYAFSKNASLILFIFFSIFTTLDYTSACTSFTMPMLITFERLVAVYLPFKFNRIITTTRTWSAVAFVYLFWLIMYVYMSFWLKFTYSYDTKFNTSVGRMERSSLYYNNHGAVEALEGILDYVAWKIAPLVTLVGCILISVKVKMASSKREKMTQGKSKDSSSASSNRLTKMLLAVCAVYMFTSAILAMPSYIPQYVQYSMISEAPTNLGPITYQVMNIAACINSSVNFVVYVGMNKQFRDTYKSLFPACWRPTNGRKSQQVHKRLRESVY